ncbi:hypothetical protein D3C79_1037520 [compost metagenome]
MGPHLVALMVAPVADQGIFGPQQRFELEVIGHAGIAVEAKITVAADPQFFLMVFATAGDHEVQPIRRPRVIVKAENAGRLLTPGHQPLDHG